MAIIYRNRENEKEQRRKNTRIFSGLAFLVLLVLFAVTGSKTRSAGVENVQEPNAGRNVVSAPVTKPGGPESGTVFFRKYERNPAVFHVVNNTTADVCARCADGLFNSSVVNFYLRAGEEITLEVPVGYYEFHLATGEQWIDAEHLFGEETLYLTDTLRNGLEFGRKRICEFVIEPGFSNMKELTKEQY